MDAPIRERLHPVFRALDQFKFLILGCITFCTLGGIIFALMTPKIYQANLPFLVRDEASGPLLKPGRFESLEAMKSAQETIQEITKNPEVLRKALREVGPANWMTNIEEYPAYEDIEDFRGNVWISAANGSELGKTEVIHLNVRSTSRERALQLIQHIADGVRTQLREVRGRRAASIEAELTAALETAQDHLHRITERVVAMEVELGEDLNELRTMSTPFSGEGTLRQALLQLDTQLLTAQSDLDEVTHQIQFFEQAIQRPESLSGVPSDVLDQFPALRELKQGLVKAQLELARVASTYNAKSSRYQQAENQIANIEHRIQTEIQTAIEAAESQAFFVKNRMVSLRQQQDGLRTRIQRLARLRAPYSNLLEELKVATEHYRAARTEYSDAVALQKGTLQTDLLTQLENPEVGTQPVSVSRSKVVLGSLGGGIFISLGLVMLLTNPGHTVSETRLEQLARQRDAQH